MIRIGQQSIIDSLSFAETLPRASAFAEVYLRQVAEGVRGCDPPVTLSLDEVKGPGVRFPVCLIVTPTERRLRKFQSLHFARALNSNLQMGFYVIGADSQPHQSTFRAQVGIGGPSQADADSVVALVELIQEFAVLPAMEHVASLVQSKHGQGRGFLGA